MHQQISKPGLQTRTFLEKEKVRSITARKRTAYFVCKRFIDILLVLLTLPILIPVALVIMALIKLDSKGPALFKQERVGSRQIQMTSGIRWVPQNFTLLKFRTMVPNASSSIHKTFVQAYIAGDEAEMAKIQNRSSSTVDKYKLEHDPRITRVGHWLRKTSLDELPQIWNVLKGDMSLVGPRPAIPYEVEMYEIWHKQRLQTKQGLTGFWQTSGRNSISFDDMVNLDIEYIKKQSVWLDLRILFLTLPTVILRKGAE